MQRRARYAALGLAGLVGLAGIVLLVWLVPPALYKQVDNEQARVSAEASTRTGLLAGLAGLAALGGLAVTARTYQLTQQGQVTERYTKAIEQLGFDKLDVRLGGIYALERIAVDSKRDHPTVVEVLGAFVREHSHPTHAAPEPTLAQVLSAFLGGDGEPAAGHQPNGGTGKESGSPRRPATDVQAAVAVLGRLPQQSGVRRGDLTCALLAGARLNEANLSGARLNGADLSGARLDRADLSDARLNGADLSGAELNRADLSDARLLKWSSDRWPPPSDPSLGANLSGARLYYANLSGAKLDEANLSGAVLQGANLSGAVLNGADLSGAQLNQTKGLTQAQLDRAQGDDRTVLPSELRRPAGWTESAAAPDRPQADGV